MKIRSKLWLNALITVLCLIAVGGIGSFYTAQVAKVSHSLVDNEALPIFEVDNLEKMTWEMWSRLIVHTSTSEVEAMQKLEEEILKLKKQIVEKTESVRTLHENSNDSEVSISYLDNFQIDWAEFEKIADQVLDFSNEFAKEDASFLIVKTGRIAFDQARATLEGLQENHHQDMEIKRAKAESTKNQALWTTLLIMFFMSLGALGALFFISRSITKPLASAMNAANQIADGNLTARAKIRHANDELGELLISMNTMADKLQSIIQSVGITLDKIARSETDIQIGTEFVGDFETIKESLEMTAQQLTEATAKNTLDTWLKTGQAELNNIMSGEQKITMLAKNVISFLSTYGGGQVGLFYLLKEPEQIDHPPYLEMIASYAYTACDNRPSRFSIGEGLVGQAALERKTVDFMQARDDCPSIVRSGLANIQPYHILIFPLLYEGSVKGVIEIGSSKPLSKSQRNFLEQAMPNIAVALNTTESRDKMQVLLQQTQIQSIELKGKTEEMEKQQAVLQQTNEELQTQSEELQTQQEELRQSNEELESRTRDLEQQRNEIRQKNTLLEKAQAEMEKAKQAIETKAKELELASKYKSEFLANMSHELRTPLNSLLILAQILSENRGGNLTEKQVGYTKTIYSAGSDLLRLINEILDLSKVEAGRIEIHIESLSIGDLLEATEHKFKPMAEQKGLEFKVSMAEDFPQLLKTDSHRLQQIINNLLSNAFKFTKQGKVTLSLSRPKEHIENLELKTDKILAVSVSDTGIGIPKDKQQVIFEAFQQADGTTSRKFGGTGLGLSISRQLARLLGGDLVLESEENKGSIFTLYLPETPPNIESTPAPQSDAQETVKIEAEKQETVVSEKIAEEIVESEEQAHYPDDREDLSPEDKSILVIEDDRKFLDILVTLLRERNFKAIVAEDGTAGLMLAERYKPSAIILDIGLPKMDGWSVMERLKNNPEIRHIPVHFMSAADQKSQDARKMGAIGYLSKPVNVNELEQAFKNIEGFISKNLKQVLLVCDNEQRKHQILDLVETDDIKVRVAANQKEIYQRLKESKFDFDCVIVDISTEQNVCIGLVEHLAEKEALPLQIPVIIYTDRDLTREEEISLKHCEESITIKSVQSPERLLDETTLFLHQLEAKLSKEKQKMLHLVHDKEAILDGKKVMIVDDDVRNTFALMSFLEGKNMEVIVANHGKEALELLANKENQDVAMILMDIMMPEMDGYETMQKIREKPQFHKLPIIALTAKAMKGDKAKCIEAGANDYVAKPVDTDKLLSLMRVWLYR